METKPLNISEAAETTTENQGADAQMESRNKYSNAEIHMWDFYAANAMNGLLAGNAVTDLDAPQKAAEMADKMIKERRKYLPRY